ncbi:hypothetical protein SAMN05421641_101155 [Paracoccus thiocyanatus]|uniref:Meckel syndrome type 1 protein n=1 Tax=Paracoccus thiocyanatus TaxID=34006 RepID=A0A1N6N715_9RHOB|nr:hypothetical protein SAMN05421641_101155 [Paracoccus thiocyanatus]
MHLDRRDRGPEQERPATPRPWRHLGSVDFASAEFGAELARLRAMATAGDGGTALPVTLVIPDDQILYTTLTVAPGADREQAVGRALDGLTPYAIEDLAFDWRGEGDSVRVAAVARQTLREAADFARQYGFEGQGYRAAPAAGLYPGEPVFVLAAAPRARPQVDPAQAGVTAGALLIEDEAAEDEDQARPGPEQPGAFDLDGDGIDDAGDKATVWSPPQAAAEPGIEKFEDQSINHSSETEKRPDTGKTDGAETLVPVAGETPPAAADRTDAASKSAGPVGAAQNADAGPGARPLPAAAGHGAGHTAAAPVLNPRAQALHDRAASARQARPVGSAPAQPRRPGERGGLAGLIAMLGVLVIGLILIWAFLVPDRQDAAPAATTAAPAAATSPAPSAPRTAAPAGAEPPQPTAAAPVDPAPAPADIRAEPEPGPAPAASAAPPGSALTEQERRRVLVAATAVAAAVVPPPAAEPAAPQAASSPPPAEPAATRTATETAIEAAIETAVRDAATQPAATAAPAAADAVATQGARPAPPAAQLTRSARPQLAPRRSTPQTTVPRADTAPRVPGDPLPFEAGQNRNPPVNSARPPARSQPPAAAPATSAPAAAPAGNTVLGGSARPPLRPEGSAPELLDPDRAEALDPAERSLLRDLVRDLGRHGLIARPTPLWGERLAQARPQPRPGTAPAATASDAVNPSAIDAALRSAASSPPDRPARPDAAAAAPARDSGGLLRGATRPRARPASQNAPAVSDDAVKAALSAAAATPGAVQLSALASSPLPPRRSDRSDSATAAEAPASEGAELAARRKLDEQLQAQAEARIRARAAADAKAEAEARAQAEARARAQAEAEERAARARRQDYKPPEVDNEPEMAAGALPKGATAATVAKAATQPRGIDMGRTTIIGIIGAGKASRALIRLRSGKVVTVRLGDRIDGGTINAIGDGRLTYVKGGRTHELRMLDGR